MENEFPPNSHTKREVRTTRTVEKAEPEQRDVKRVISGKATMRKKPLHRKFFEAFRPEDARGFIEYVVLDVFVTGVKDVVADATISTVENALGVDGRSRARSRSRRDGGYTHYSGMGGSRSRGRDRDRDRRDRRDRDDDRRREPRGFVDHSEIILDTRVEAEEVLEMMYEILSKYEAVTRRDLLGMVGEHHEFTDQDWGWTDLRGARVHKVRDGYLLDLPRADYLD